MTRLPSLFGWFHAISRLRILAGVALLVLLDQASLFAQSLPPTAPGAPEAKPPTKSSATLRNQLLIGAGAAAGSGPGGTRITMRVEYAPFGRQALLVGVSAEEQVGRTALMLLGMPVSRRFGSYRAWLAPMAAFDDEPSWVGSGGMSREFGLRGNDVVGTASLNRIRATWQWSLNFSFVNEKW